MDQRPLPKRRITPPPQPPAPAYREIRDDRQARGEHDEADHERLAARSLARYFPSRSYGVVVRKGKYLSPQARAFTELIQPALFQRADYYATGQSDR